MPTLTPGQEMLAQGFALQLEMYGHILSSGTNSFPCLMGPVNPFEPDMAEMFKDIREASVATVLSSNFPSWLTALMTLTDENGQQWKTVKIVNNPSEIATEVWLAKVTSKDH